MISWQIDSILFSCGKELFFQLVNLSVQLLDVSCLRNALIDLRPVQAAFAISLPILFENMDLLTREKELKTMRSPVLH